MKPTTLLLLMVLPVAGVRAADPWRALAAYQPERAITQFHQQAAQGGESARTARFGEALALLAQPSPLANRVGQARALLQALAADGTDDVALGARFYLARLAEFQLEPPDPRLAAEGFRALITEHPDSPWAQAALPRLAILLLYTAAGPETPLARIAAAERLLPAVTQPLATAELHLVIADAVFHYRLPDARALAHLVEAERTGVLDTVTRGDVLVQLGELCRLGGDHERSFHYYRMFLKEYPRDVRQFPVRKQMATMDEAKPDLVVGRGR